MWTPEMEAELRRLFNTGLSYERLAEQFGLSRNAIASKLKRMGLRRGSVIHDPNDDRGGVPRAGKVTLPPLASLKEAP